MEKFTVNPMPQSFTKTCNNHNFYALVHSSAFKKVNGATLGNETDIDCLEGLVKISHGCNRVYRKMRTYTAEGFGVDGNCVCLDYRTRKILKVEAIDKDKNDSTTEENKVTIEPTNWFCYLWNHVDSTIKWPFRITFVSLVITVVCSVLSFFIK